MNGELFTKPLRSAKAKLEYVCGGEEETYCPKFTFMGFRYAELCGIEPENVKVRMKVISSIDEETGDFFCSNESINRLQKNIRYSGFQTSLRSRPTVRSATKDSVGRATSPFCFDGVFQLQYEPLS